MENLNVLVNEIQQSGQRLRTLADLIIKKSNISADRKGRNENRIETISLYVDKKSKNHLVRFSPSTIIEEHTYGMKKIAIVVSGKLKFQTNNVVKFLAPGDHVIMKPGKNYTFTAMKESEAFFITILI